MSRGQVWVGVIVLTLIGFTLRLYHIDSTSFRGDEAFTILNWVRSPLVETLTGIVPTSDPQPPLAYAVFRGWGLLLGDSEFSMRVLPAMINTIGIAVSYALGQRIGGRGLGLLVTLLWALHPFLIWHSQDARNYALWSTASITALWLGLRALEKRRRVDWLLYIAAAVTAAYLYYLELFLVASLNLYVLYTFAARRISRRQLVYWILVQAVVGLLLAPWFLQERLLSGGGYGGTTGRFDPPLLLTWFLPDLMFGVTLPDGWAASLWVFVLVLLVAGLLVLWRRNRDYAVLTGLLLLLPPLLLALVSLRLNVFTPRYILGVVPAFLLLTGSVIVYLGQRQRALAVLVCAAILTVNGITLANYYTSYTKSSPWRDLTTYLHTAVQPDDLVIQSSSDIAFTLYYDAFTEIRYLPANPNQAVAEIQNVLSASAERFHSFWVVGQTPPDWNNTPGRDQWLAEHMQLVRDTTIENLPVRQYAPWIVTETLRDSPLAHFTDLADLQDVTLGIEPDNTVTAWLYWLPVSAANRDYKVFVHLLSGTDIISQADSYPQAGRISTSGWLPGQIYRDVYELSVEHVPAGHYTLIAGFYDPETGERITTGDGSDHVVIGTITLPPG